MIERINKPGQEGVIVDQTELDVVDPQQNAGEATIREKLLILARIVGAPAVVALVTYVSLGCGGDDSRPAIRDLDGDGILSFKDVPKVWKSSGANTDVNADGITEAVDAAILRSRVGLDTISPPNYNVVSQQDGDRAPDNIVSCVDLAAVEAAEGKLVQSKGPWMDFIGENALAVGVDADELTVKLGNRVNTQNAIATLTDPSQFGLEVTDVRDIKESHQPAEIDIKIPPAKLNIDGILGTEQKLEAYPKIANARLIEVGGAYQEPVGTPQQCDTSTPAK